MIRLFIKKLLTPIVREVIEEEQKKELDLAKEQIRRCLEEIVSTSPDGSL